MLPRALRTLASLAFILCAFALTACSPSTANVAGSYELDKEAVKKAMQAEIDKQKAAGEEDPMAGMAMAMVDSMTVTMTLNADGTANMNMTMPMMGSGQAATGTWTLSGSRITVTAAAEGEEPTPKTGTVSGDTITFEKVEGDDDMPFDMVFKKKAA
jgi:hypothetical protein